MKAELWVVVPAYNERDAVSGVVREWAPVLRESGASFVLCVLNDGSRDDTLEVLEGLRSEVPELRIVDKPNSGHGQTCVEGYRLALAEGADWIFQIDSDGQCDPRHFPLLWGARDGADAIYGFRRVREDGAARYWVSRAVSFTAFLGFGVWVRDANVPYRLMSRRAVESLGDGVPSDFHLANVLVALIQERRYGIRWVDITFRQRSGGTPSVKALSFAGRGVQLFRQLCAVRVSEGRSFGIRNTDRWAGRARQD